MGARICKSYSNAPTCGSTPTCWIAAKIGHIECLRYLHENGAPWDSMTCTSAAAWGSSRMSQVRS